MFLTKAVYFVCLCITWAQLSTTQCTGKPKVRVDVYYTTMSKLSGQFIRNKLYPVMQSNFSSNIDLRLFPYGKTQTITRGNVTTFFCDNGPAECYGNKLQSCAIFLINNGKRSEGSNYTEKLLQYVDCFMESVQLNSNIEMLKNASIKCETELNAPITACADSGMAISILKNIGEQTLRVQSSLDVIPTIVFNNELDETNSALALNNFQITVEEIYNAQNVSDCEENGVENQTNTSNNFDVPLTKIPDDQSTSTPGNFNVFRLTIPDTLNNSKVPPADKSEGSRLKLLWPEIVILLLLVFVK